MASKEYQKAYRLKNKKRLQESARQYYLKNSEERIKYQKEYNKKNRKKINKTARECYRNNPETRLKDLARSARRKGDDWANRDIFYLVQRINEIQYGMLTCENCAEACVGNSNFDHIVPVSLGGKGNIDNLQILCQPCNLEKQVYSIDFRNFNPIYAN